MKKILSLVLAVLMILSMFPVAVLAEELKDGETESLEETVEFPEETKRTVETEIGYVPLMSADSIPKVVNYEDLEYGLAVGGVAVTNANKNDIFGDGTAHYDSDYNTLYLNGATLDYMTICMDGEPILVGVSIYAMRQDYGFEIVLAGDNSLAGYIQSATSVGIAGTDDGAKLTVNGWILCSDTYDDWYDNYSPLRFYGDHAVTLTVTDNLYYGYCDEQGYFDPTKVPASDTGSVLNVNGVNNIEYNGIESSPKVYLTLGMTMVTWWNADDIFGDGKASYDWETNTLYLNNATIVGTGVTVSDEEGKLLADDAAIYVCTRDIGFSIVATGNNTITGNIYSPTNVFVSANQSGATLTVDGDIICTGDWKDIYDDYSPLALTGTKKVSLKVTGNLYYEGEVFDPKDVPMGGTGSLLNVNGVDIQNNDEESYLKGFCGADETAEYDEASNAYKNLWWTLDSEGTLTIGGEGTMQNYDNFLISDSIAPWSQYNNQLKTLVIEDGVTSIGDYAFFGCSGFTGNLVIPNSVTSIGDYAFFGCSGLTGDLVIPNSVTSIGNYAFSGCSGFTGDLVIPDSVASIGANPFGFCLGLENILVSDNNPYYSSKDGILYNKDQTILLACPTGKTGTMTIPDSVTSIGELAFYGCSGFTGNLVIPNSVASIGEGAFFGCSGFTGDLVIGNSVTSIGEGAFFGCSGFTGNLVIPNSVTSIGEGAFSGCSGLTGDLVIGNSVTSIGGRAFWGCSGLTGDLVIPNSVTSIGNWAFAACSGFTGNLVIGDGVTSIGEGAFSVCSGFTGIYFKGNAPTIVEATIYGSSFDSDVTLYYIEGKSGWTSPTWNGYSTKIWSGLSATLDISSTAVTENKAGTVSLTLSENSGVAAMQMVLTYDAEKLILESSELGENFVGKGFEINTNIPGQVIIAWDDTEPMTMGGTLLDLTFHAKEGAEFGEVPISIPINDDFVFVDENHHDILLKVNTGTVEICDVLLGDVNEDGKINILDANIVRRSSAKLLILDDKQKLAADVNNDGFVNVIDANLIRRYAAKLITEFPEAN